MRVFIFTPSYVLLTPTSPLSFPKSSSFCFHIIYIHIIYINHYSRYLKHMTFVCVSLTRFSWCDHPSFTIFLQMSQFHFLLILNNTLHCVYVSYFHHFSIYNVDVGSMLSLNLWHCYQCHKAWYENMGMHVCLWYEDLDSSEFISRSSIAKSHDSSIFSF